MKIRLTHYETASFITLLNSDGRQIKSINYGRKIHKYEAENDFKLLSCENNTYGNMAMLELFEYLEGARK